jgi:hypothetical protein
MEQTAVETIISEFNKELEVAIQIGNESKIRIIKHLINIATSYLPMEKEQRKKDFVNGYKSRAKESNLIFDETSEMYAIKLFNETFKSE